jgi:glycosyltransferase involved in cell wall biosynthesis
MHRSVRTHILRLNRQTPLDAIIGSFAYPDLVAASELSRELGCPLIALVVGSDMNELAQRPSLRPHIRRALEHASVVVTLSNGLRDRVLDLGISPKKVVVQHNGVDGSRFTIKERREARQELNLDRDGSLIVFVGNLAFEKGPDVLLEAFRVLGSTHLRLTYVGDGTLRTQLQREVGHLGMADRITFAGRRSPEEIATWMAAADVLCLSSRREGCPNVILEALACGRPVVATNVGGVPELLNQRNGIIVPPENPDALARALLAAVQQQWHPTELRSSVESLSWDAFSKVFYDAILAAVPADVRGRWAQQN